MPRGKIKYVTGDATNPVGDGKKIICHVCNDVGAWGRGFVLSLSKRWKEPEDVYRKTNVRDLYLGKVIVVPVTETILVANMVAQRDIKPGPDGMPPIRYGALRACLASVNDLAYKTGSTLHMPRIGAGLAGGDWIEIEKIISDVASVDVFIYDLNKN